MIVSDSGPRPHGEPSDPPTDPPEQVTGRCAECLYFFEGGSEGVCVWEPAHFDLGRHRNIARQGLYAEVVSRTHTCDGWEGA